MEASTGKKGEVIGRTGMHVEPYSVRYESERGNYGRRERTRGIEYGEGVCKHGVIV